MKLSQQPTRGPLLYPFHGGSQAYRGWLTQDQEAGCEYWEVMLFHPHFQHQVGWTQWMESKVLMYHQLVKAWEAGGGRHYQFFLFSSFSTPGKARAPQAGKRCPVYGPPSSFHPVPVFPWLIHLLLLCVHWVPHSDKGSKGRCCLTRHFGARLLCV